MTTTIFRVLGAASVAAVVLAAPARAQDLGLTLGTQAPNAMVHTLDGARADLSRYVGHGPVLIEFWATWCPNCKELRPTMDAMAAKYGGRVQFVGVAVSVNENPKRVKAFVAKYHLPGAQFFDAEGDATDKYDVPATSYVVIADSTGKIVYTGLGGKQDLDAALRKVR
jgi:thiol-disulfide isomerase/thioredoxin